MDTLDLDKILKIHGEEQEKYIIELAKNIKANPLQVFLTEKEVLETINNLN